MGENEETTGLVCVSAGVLFSVCANTLVKLMQEVPVLQMTQARFGLQCWISLCIALGLKLFGVKVSLLGSEGVRFLLILRATLFSLALGCLWAAMRTMPIGETTAILYLHPVVCGLLAKWLLQEKLGFEFLLQASVSSVGVLMVVNPFGDGSYHSVDLTGITLAFMACLFFATGSIAVRMLKGTQQIEIQVFQDVMAACVLLPLAQGVLGTSTSWSVWDSRHVILLLAFTACGLTASLFIITGFTMASASKAALSCYLEVPAAFLVQVFFFNQPVGPVRVIGALLITVSAAGRVIMEYLRTSDDIPEAKRLLVEANRGYSTLWVESDEEFDSEAELGRLISPAAYGAVWIPQEHLQDTFTRSVTEPSYVEDGDRLPIPANRSMTLA